MRPSWRAVTLARSGDCGPAVAVLFIIKLEAGDTPAASNAGQVPSPPQRNGIGFRSDAILRLGRRLVRVRAEAEEAGVHESRAQAATARWSRGAGRGCIIRAPPVRSGPCPRCRSHRYAAIRT